MPKYIAKFDGTEHAFLSNFRHSPIVLYFFPLQKKAFDKPLEFPTVEHAYQAAKTLNAEEREKIRVAETPALSKKLGRQCTLREDWENLKDMTMLFCLRKKYKIPDLREKLLATGDAILVEGNTWHDCHFGVCYCDKCQGVGKNMLGTLLMQVRYEIHTGTEDDSQEHLTEFYESLFGQGHA